MSVVSLEQAREERTPHLSGAAACMVCHHSWVAVAPVGTHELECQKCHATKGYYVAPVVVGQEMWECNCGCSVFHISREIGPYCVNCGIEAIGWF